MEDVPSGRDVGGAEPDREVQGRGRGAADGRHGGDIHGGVDGEIGGRVVGWCEGVVFD